MNPYTLNKIAAEEVEEKKDPRPFNHRGWDYGAQAVPFGPPILGAMRNWGEDSENNALVGGLKGAGGAILGGYGGLALGGLAGAGIGGLGDLIINPRNPTGDFTAGGALVGALLGAISGAGEGSRWSLSRGGKDIFSNKGRRQAIKKEEEEKKSKKEEEKKSKKEASKNTNPYTLNKIAAEETIPTLHNPYLDDKSNKKIFGILDENMGREAGDSFERYDSALFASEAEEDELLRRLKNRNLLKNVLTSLGSGLVGGAAGAAIGHTQGGTNSTLGGGILGALTGAVAGPTLFPSKVNEDNYKEFVADKKLPDDTYFDYMDTWNEYHDDPARVKEREEQMKRDQAFRQEILDSISANPDWDVISTSKQASKNTNPYTREPNVAETIKPNPKGLRNGVPVDVGVMDYVLKEKAKKLKPKT